MAMSLYSINKKEVNASVKAKVQAADNEASHSHCTSLTRQSQITWSMQGKDAEI